MAEEIIPKNTEETKKYELMGEVARLDIENKIATIKHQPIGDWMGAMTMDFPVKDAADFAKLVSRQACPCFGFCPRCRLLGRRSEVSEPDSTLMLPYSIVSGLCPRG